MTTVQLADRQLAAHHEAAADDHHQRGAEDGDGAHHHREQRLLPGDRDPRVHRGHAVGLVALQLERLAGEALDQLHRAERFVEPAEQLGLELLDALLAVDQRPGVEAEAEEQERHDRQRQQRDRHVHVEQPAEHHRERDGRRGEREQAAHHQVLDRVGVDVDAVDGVRRAGGDVMVQAERGQVREQLAAQVVDHPLAGVDLHLRAVGRDELVDDLQHARRPRPRTRAARSGCRG